MVKKGRDDLEAIRRDVIACRACPRLVRWREEVAREKTARFADQEYWGRPLPGFGDPNAKILILGLAPAAHGGNRTGRIFTGDRSGDFLYASLFRAGLANQPTSISADDGLELRGVYVAAAVRCAPPGNAPQPAERDNCLPYLVREIDALTELRAIVALGLFAWGAALLGVAANHGSVRPKPTFGHGAVADVGPFELFGCYHPSQQNTFTGKLTEPMIDDVIVRAARAAGLRPPRRRRRGDRSPEP
jgi:uracil-DNA glycosylase family 4